MLTRAVKKFLSEIGSKGGKTTGATKVRGDAEYYRKIAANRKKKGAVVEEVPAPMPAPVSPESNAP